MGEFLTEATLIGVLGGLVGYGLGAAITLIVNGTTPPGQSTLFLLTPALTIFAIGFATVLGASGRRPSRLACGSGWTQSPPQNQ